MDQFASLIATSVNAATPILIVALGLLINERAGTLNLGAEGTMLVSAVIAFATAIGTHSVALGFVCGTLAGMAMAALFAAFAIGLTTNQVATGLAISLFGTGFSAFVGQKYVGASLQSLPVHIPWLSDLPFVGVALFSYHWVVYFGIGLTIAIQLFLYRARAGLVLRAVGESPESAHALGYSVKRIRFAALLFGGACTGLAGAYLSLVYTPMWVEGMSAGRGWIALALTTFATWRPARVLLGAWLFGGVTIIQFYLQTAGVAIPSQILSMLPYLATVIVLLLISSNATWIRVNMPASLGRPFRAAG
jgi:ABC-type uncharacterized transport system permease subunit